MRGHNLPDRYPGTVLINAPLSTCAKMVTARLSDRANYEIPKFLCKELSSAPAAKCVVGFSFYIVSDRLSREKKYKGILTTSGHIRRLLRTKSCSFSDPGSKTWCSDVNHLKFRI
jgi:hypothetical protein